MYTLPFHLKLKHLGLRTQQSKYVITVMLFRWCYVSRVTKQVSGLSDSLKILSDGDRAMNNKDWMTPSRSLHPNNIFHDNPQYALGISNPEGVWMIFIIENSWQWHSCIFLFLLEGLFTNWKIGGISKKAISLWPQLTLNLIHSIINKYYIHLLL